MRSDKLIRLGEESHTERNDAARAEIARQTAEYLARGNTITVVPSGPAARAGEVYDPVSGRLVGRAGRSTLNGRAVLTMAAMERLTGISDTTLRKMIKRGEFPAPVVKRQPMAWDETEVHAWIAENEERKADE